MKDITDVLEEINQRIGELQRLENDYKKNHNISGRLNVKTRREELIRLKEIILSKSRSV